MLSGLAASGGVLADDVPDGIAGFVLWDEKRVEAIADRLELELGDKPLVYETVGNYDGYSMYLVLRGLTGKAELHETESDFQIGMRGRATLLIGGELVGAEKKTRKQQHGTSLAGAASHPLLPGDIIHVPVAVPHQIVIEPGETYTYLLIKLNEEPLD